MKKAALTMGLALLSPLTMAMNDAGLSETGTNRLIVKYASNISNDSLMSNQSLESAIGARVLNVRAMANGSKVLDLGLRKSNEEMRQIANEIQNQPGVLYAEPDYIMKPQAAPDDTQYSNQWHYFETAGGINLPAAWDITTGSSDITVAVIDTGVVNHSDLAENLLPGYDFISDVDVSQDGNGRDSDARDAGDFTPAGACGTNPQTGQPEPPRDKNSSWHGTHVAGTIAAVSNNGQGVAGVSWTSSILPVRVLGRCGGYTSDITDGMLWAAGLSVPGVPNNPNPAKVLNLSLGGGSPCSQTYQNTINRVRAAGATIVVAAGNSNDNADKFSPASCDGVITVAANKRDGGRSYYSNYGGSVDLAAPGGETIVETDGILSTLNSGKKQPEGDSYAYYQGTSMATPHVAGVASLMYAVNADLTPDQVESILKSTARSFPSVSQRQCTTALCGTGIMDAAAAVTAARDGDGGTQPNDSVLTKGEAKTGLSGSKGESLTFTFDVPTGATNLSFVMSGGSGDADLYVRHGSAPTTSSYDCRSWASGNNETCNSFSSPKAGTWHVTVRGYTSFNGASLIADYEEGSSGPSEVKEFTNNQSVAIPDNRSSGVTSTIDSTYTGQAGNITLGVNITHTFRGDVKIVLIAPNGTEYSVKNTSNDSANNIVGSYQVNAQGVSANGTWKLKVSDHAWRDTGTLNSWSLSFN
ncbi:S8 family serine peptidase [Endozoicomonadaceae bacterium StTr2]